MEFLTLFLSESRLSILHGGCSLAVSSVVGFVGLASWALFNGFCSVGSLGCLVLTPIAVSVARSLVPSVVAPECAVPRPRRVSEDQSGSACGPSTLWRSEVAVPVVRGSFSRGCSVSLVLFEFIAYLIGLNSNPSGSSHPWVAARPSGSLARVREVMNMMNWKMMGPGTSDELLNYTRPYS
ncbi:hypothetical protein Taro_013818 [Colocasia esculenta]|uniref:Uncharacterized protein n=1 Tax=Colocasia esculenta TaxID=4460 RepID=A0A843UJX1_COLES|nr:hypothetical protein [Colocasia esculenta]